MTTQVKHAKVSTIADGADATKVRPSDWNADHDVAVDAVDVAYDHTSSGLAATDAQAAIDELAASTAVLSDDPPLVELGSGDPGDSDEASRSDHVHPDAGSAGATSFHGVRAFHSTTQSVANGGVYRTLAFDSTDYDSDGYHDEVTNNSRLTVPAGLGGRYLIFASVAIDSAASGQRIIAIWKNGTEALLVPVSDSFHENTSHDGLVTIQQLDEGDYVELKIYQDTPGSLVVDGPGTNPGHQYIPSFGMALMTNGAQGVQGDPGADGADGLGVPAGGTTGQVLAKVSNTDNDTEWVDPETAGGSGQGLVDFAFKKRTSGDVTLNSTSFANVDTGLDLVLDAAAGDVIEVGVSEWWGGESGAYGLLDVATIVSGSPVNYISGGATNGVAGWIGVLGVPTPVGATVLYTLQSGDIAAGTVTLRLRYRTTAASNVTFRASTSTPFHWYAKNLGPAL